MEREPFLAEIAARLRRRRTSTPPIRAYAGRCPSLAQIPTTELVSRFSQELTALHGEVALARSAADATALLEAEVTDKRVVSWSREELERCAGLPLSGVSERWCEPSAPDFRARTLGADVGITGVDHAIADTGTLVLSAGVGRPRSVSLAPRLHIALVQQSQLVPRLGMALRGYAEQTPSAVHFISGPSRTSDIENDLSIGVHGPARVLAIILLENGA